MATVSPVQSVLVERLEGTPARRECATLAEAETALRAWSLDVRGSSYDKCRVTVTWADGQAWRGRYDLHAPEYRGPIDLAAHVCASLHRISEIDAPAFCATHAL